MELDIIYDKECLFGMEKYVDDKSIDMILCDLPYQRTKNSWDCIIPYDLLWSAYDRIIKPNGVVCLFADGMFMAELMISNKKKWKYNLVWDKVLTSGFLNANIMPLRQHEEICIFYDKKPVYNPQKTKGSKNHSQGVPKQTANNNYGAREFQDNAETLGDMKHPTSIQKFSKPHPSVMIHPTEKPAGLLEWLIKTYTNPDMVVLDNCIGSGSTAIACIHTKRHFIGFDNGMDTNPKSKNFGKKWADIARERVTLENEQQEKI